MSYKELVMQAYYNKYKKFPDDYPTHKPLTEEEKRTNDQLFGIPYFGQNWTLKKTFLLKVEKIIKTRLFDSRIIH